MSSFTFEPIAALSSFFLTVRMTKPSDAGLRASVEALEQRTKQIRSSEKVAWLEIYREALPLLDRVATSGDARAAPGATTRAASPSNVGSAVMQLQSTLQRAGTDWSQRLATQERDVLGEAEKAIEKLTLESRFDEKLGELVYHYAESEVQAFHEWLLAAEKRWLENNEALVSRRANEAIGETALEDAGAAFEVKPAELRLPKREPPRLKGSHVARPGFFQSLGASYRLVMSTVTGVSGLGMVLSRIDSVSKSVREVLPLASGVVLLGAVGFAAVTIPRERRQAMARLEARSLELVRRELLEAVRSRLKVTSEEQRAAIQRHLAAESRRAATVLRGAGGGTGEMMTPMPSVGGGLLANDVARMRGEWREAIERRIAELAAEVGDAQESA